MTQGTQGVGVAGENRSNTAATGWSASVEVELTSTGDQ